MSKLISRISSVLLGLCIFGENAFAEDTPSNLGINMPRGVTPMSVDIYYLHMTIFWICVAIGIGVFGVMIYSLIRHRKSTGHTPANFHSSTKVEILWAVIPFLLLVIMAIPSTKVLMHMENSEKSDINIKVTGYQWKWEYEYLDLGIRFFSNLSTPQDQLDNKAPKDKWYLLEVDKPLVLPIHKKIRFLVTSNDVVHAWWVPALGIKRDAIPGFIHESWARIQKPGIYRGQCAELCGMHHGFMPIVVVAKTEKDFDKWVEEQTKNQQASPAQPNSTTNAAIASQPVAQNVLMDEGKKLYESTCAACHKPDGSGMPPAFPALVGGPITIGPVKNHIDIVLNGKTGTAMQSFANQLNDREIAAIVTYERNAWGNSDKNKYGKDAGGTVQPADVAKQRKQ